MSKIFQDIILTDRDGNAKLYQFKDWVKFLAKAKNGKNYQTFLKAKHYKEKPDQVTEEGRIRYVCGDFVVAYLEYLGFKIQEI